MATGEPKDAPRAGETDEPASGAPSSDDPQRYASLHDLIDEDPYLNEPFWPPILMGLALAAVISLVILCRHGVVSF